MKWMISGEGAANVPLRIGSLRFAGERGMAYIDVSFHGKRRFFPSPKPPSLFKKSGILEFTVIYRPLPSEAKGA
jgi:hypothetical protein